LAGGFGHGKKIYFSALRLFVALNWLANILLFLSIQCGRCAF
jgi:hypothetical protein